MSNGFVSMPGLGNDFSLGKSLQKFSIEDDFSLLSRSVANKNLFYIKEKCVSMLCSNQGKDFSFISCSFLSCFFAFYFFVNLPIYVNMLVIDLTKLDIFMFLFDFLSSVFFVISSLFLVKVIKNWS